MMDVNATGWSLLVIAAFHALLACQALLTWQARRALKAHWAASAQRAAAFRGFVARRRDEQIRDLPDLNPDAFISGEESLCRSVRTIARGVCHE